MNLTNPDLETEFDFREEVDVKWITIPTGSSRFQNSFCHY
jgi:hypothetical protein